jgi:cytochrome c peroxidase
MKKNILYIMVGILLTVALMQGCMKERNFNENGQDPNVSATMAMKNTGVFALSDKATLGKNIFFDKISVPGNMSCASCHAPDYGFTGSSGSNISGIYEGAFRGRYGNRKPPSAAYAAFSPVFHSDGSNFIGGNFWDGRATGLRLGNPSAEQALGPFLNPLEMNNPSKESVLKQIAKSSYAKMWKSVWGEPIRYSTPTEIDDNYDRVGYAIAAYEASGEVSQFSSKFDYYLKGKVQLTKDEDAGRRLFNGKKAKCSSCHVSDGNKPLFTDFTFDNIGTPKNPANPFYKEDKVFLPNGQAINPLGSSWIDPGLGGFLITQPTWRAMADANWGKHKVPTLRNVGKSNGPYMHNGVFKSLNEVVHFYNTRDITNWPRPEVPQNVNGVVGKLGLSNKEENEIVAFMKTLSDGYVIK